MKVLVCGGRSYGGMKRLWHELDLLHEDGVISHLIHGGAPGADAHAHAWAVHRGVQTVECRANWKAHGKGAGPRRNACMLELGPHLVLAFPGGAGAASMVRISKASGVRVVEIQDEQ